MGRSINSRRTAAEHDPWPVAYFTLAEHRYRFDAPYKPENTYDEWKANVPYAKGDVVLVEDGNEKGYCKAMILWFFPERTYYGDRTTKFRIVRETKAGHWSKSWEYTYPGFIQRAYAKAGLAPDVPL